MEIIGMGVLLAIGFYFAPVIIGAVFFVAGAISFGICRLFGGCR